MNLLGKSGINDGKVGTIVSFSALFRFLCTFGTNTQFKVHLECRKFFVNNFFSLLLDVQRTICVSSRKQKLPAFLRQFLSFI